MVQKLDLYIYFNYNALKFKETAHMRKARHANNVAKNN